MTTSQNNTYLSLLIRLLDALISTLTYGAAVMGSGRCGSPGGKASIVMVGLLCLFTMLAGHVLLFRKDARIWHITLQTLKNTLAIALLATLLMSVSHIRVLTPTTLALTYTAMFAASTALRTLLLKAVRAYRSSPRHQQHVIIIGSEPSCQELHNSLSHMLGLGFKVQGYFDYKPNPWFQDKSTYLGTPHDVIAYLEAHPKVRRVYCGLSSQHREDILPIINHSLNHLIAYYTVPTVRNYLPHRMRFDMIGNVPVLSLYETPLAQPGKKAMKRLFDIIFSLIVLLTIFPIALVVVSLITLITMPGPVFFTQKRTGLDGRTFRLIKFRSMKVNAQADTLQATEHDPRKTPWGDIMRRTNLDELPQFINVLRGDMSIVGPRPHMLRHTADYSRLINKYMMRHLVKPGITGWSQITGFRGETSELWQMEGRVAGDLWYIEHWRFGLDLYIIYKTIVLIFKRDKKAY